MSEAYGILHLSRLSGLDVTTLIQIQRLVQKADVPPVAIVITGASDEIMKYRQCGCFINELQHTLDLKRDALIILPDALDNLRMYGPDFHDRLKLKPYRADEPQSITFPSLQIIGIAGNAAEETDFLRWHAAMIPMVESARILFTAHPVSHWSPVPRQGFNAWRIEGPLFEATTITTHTPQPFIKQIATPPGVCQYLVFNVEEVSLDVCFKVVFNERARAVDL